MDLLIGSEYFAANLPAGYRPLYGILLDMIGDTDPVYEIEQNSRDFAPEVVDRVWRTADELGLGAIFSRQQTGYVEDDHVPLNRAGIRTIDIIDFDYGPGNAYWHTTQDRLENTSPKGLEAVGRVLAALIYRGG
jgi:Zn-dependent M28 family amino/carboxypeptidase